MELTADELAVRNELGANEVQQRVNGLSPHRMYRILVDAGYGVTFTPDQMAAFAHLATRFGKDAVIMNNSIMVPLPEDEKVRAVLRDEIEKRGKK